MRTRRTILALSAAAAMTAGAAAGSSAKPPLDFGMAGARSIAAVRVAACDREGRQAVFSGRMRKLSGTSLMVMRFGLEQRSAGGADWTRVQARALRHWRRSRPGVKRFVYRQRVRGLTAGAAYRAVVSYRWLDDGGRVVHRARRRSRPCRQYDSLPNLQVGSISARRSKLAPTTAVYSVLVLNRGDAPAGPFGVSLAVDGAVVDTQTVAGLDAGDARVVRFSGPLCASSLRAEVDPGGAVPESDEGDNALAVPCAPSH